MKKELDDLLCERYPAIFAERHLPMSQTCMCWGFDCGDGWFSLIDTLCARLQFETDRNKAPQVVARQVKEKMGELRFYADGGNDYQAGMIAFASTMSGHICEECGQPGQLLVGGSCQMVRCAAHMPEGAIPYEKYDGTVGLAP